MNEEEKKEEVKNKKEEEKKGEDAATHQVDISFVKPSFTKPTNIKDDHTENAAPAFNAAPLFSANTLSFSAPVFSANAPSFTAAAPSFSANGAPSFGATTSDQNKNENNNETVAVSPAVTNKELASVAPSNKKRIPSMTVKTENNGTPITSKQNSPKQSFGDKESILSSRSGASAEKAAVSILYCI